MNPKTLSRLIYLAALTVAAQYVVQGAMASGATLADFPTWFLVVDYGLWAIRAFVEASVIVALFQVEPKTPRHARLLFVFEAALIILITLTLGPALYALGRGQTMAATLRGGWLLAWNLALASYAPLMMAASGAAYRVAMYTPPLKLAPLPSPQAAEVPEPFDKRSRIMAILRTRPGVSAAQVAAEVGCSPSYVRKVKGEL